MYQGGNYNGKHSQEWLDKWRSVHEKRTSFDYINAMPHRYPLRLVDRVLELSPDHIKVFKNCSWNDPYFAGHFPNLPVFPGIFSAEAAGQAAGMLIMSNLMVDNPASVNDFFGYIIKMGSVVFYNPVIPGDQLLVCVKKSRQMRNIYDFNCTCDIVNPKHIVDTEQPKFVTHAVMKDFYILAGFDTSLFTDQQLRMRLYPKLLERYMEQDPEAIAEVEGIVGKPE